MKGHKYFHLTTFNHTKAEIIFEYFLLCNSIRFNVHIQSKLI